MSEKLTCEMCGEPCSKYNYYPETQVVLCGVCRSIIGKRRKETGIPVWNCSDLELKKHMKTHELDN